MRSLTRRQYELLAIAPGVTEPEELQEFLQRGLAAYVACPGPECQYNGRNHTHTQTTTLGIEACKLYLLTGGAP